MIAVLKKQPIETYFFVAALVAALSFLAVSSSATPLSVILPNIVRLAPAMTMQYFGIALVFVIFGLLVYFGRRFAYFLVERETVNENFKTFAGKFFFSAFYGLFILSATAFVVGSVMHLTSYVEPANVIRASDALLKLDWAIFGTFPPFVLQELGSVRFFDVLLVRAYQTLGFMLSLTFLLTLIARVDLFRLFFISFFCCFFISIPFWLSVPAVSPYEMYIQNIFGREHYDGELVPSVLPELALTNKMYIESLTWSVPSAGVYGVTTIPSMHVAWSTIIVYFLYRVRWYLFMPAAVWAFLNAMGTMYTLQHYAVDVIAGFAAGCAAILIAYAVLALEKKYRRAESPLFFILYLVERADVFKRIREITCLCVEKLMQHK